MKLDNKTQRLTYLGVVIAMIVAVVVWQRVSASNVPSISSVNDQIDPAGAIYHRLVGAGLCAGPQDGDYAGVVKPGSTPAHETDIVDCSIPNTGSTTVDIFDDRAAADAYSPAGDWFVVRGEFHQGGSWFWVVSTTSQDAANNAQSALEVG